MVQGLFTEWFTHLRFPGHKEVVIEGGLEGPLPAGWSVVPLNDLCARITDGAHHSPPSVDSGKQMASVRDMHEWGFNYSTCREISESDWRALAEADCHPRIGDILIAKDGANLNKHTFLVWKQEPVVLLSSIAIVRPNEGVERELLTAMLKSPKISSAIKSMRSGAAIPRIVLKDFKRLPLVWPDSITRTAFEAFVFPLHQQCRTLTETNERLSAARDLLLPRLISGQLSITQAEMELEAA